MKRLAYIVVLVLILTNLALPLEGHSAVIIRQNTLKRAVDENDPESIVRNYLLPYLEKNPKIALLFAAELNISNGAPDTRDFGERGMYGKLVDATYVLDHYEELEPQAGKILEEVKRLLLGPWENKGSTSFNFSHRSNVRELCYETGKWVTVDEAPIIRIEHYTEYTHQKRVAYVACEYTTPQDDGDYLATFQIARTK